MQPGTAVCRQYWTYCLKYIAARGLFPAGRLDRDTEGLLIITDDGDFAHKMLSPKSNVFKVYHAKLDAPVTDEDITAFETGIVIGDLHCLPAHLERLEKEGEPWAKVTHL